MNVRAALAVLTVVLLTGCGPAGQPGSPSSSSSPSSSAQNHESPYRSPTPAAPLATAAHGYTITVTTTRAIELGKVISTPQLVGGDPAVTERFNAAMRASVTDMPQNSPDVDVDDGELAGGYRTGVTRIGSGAVAGRIVLFWYGRGAAHPNQSMGTVVIATKTARPVTVNDLYLDKPVALARLRTLLPELDTSLRLKSQPMTGDGLADNWLPTLQGIEIYVPVAHVIGDFVPAIVPWDQIGDLLRPGVAEMLRAD